MGAIAPVNTSRNLVLSTDSINYPIAKSHETVAPVVSAYAPVGFSQNGVAKWVDRSGGIPLLYPSFTLGVRPPSRQGNVHRVTAKVVIPTADITSPSTASGIQPAPSKAYELTMNVEFLIPIRCTLAERQILLSQAVSFMARRFDTSAATPVVTLTGSPLVAAVIDLDSPY
jgi:hypothetical protein